MFERFVLDKSRPDVHVLYFKQAERSGGKTRLVRSISSLCLFWKTVLYWNMEKFADRVVKVEGASGNSQAHVYPGQQRRPRRFHRCSRYWHEICLYTCCFLGWLLVG